MLFYYVIGGAIVAALLVALANYRKDAKQNQNASVDTEEFEGTVGDDTTADAPAEPTNTTSAVIELTDDNWEDLLLKTKSDLPIVIEFHTAWCPGCKAQAPIYRKAALKYAGKARFFSADCDEFDHLARVGDVKKIPTTFFIEPASKTQIAHVGLVQLDEFGSILDDLQARVAAGDASEDAEHPYLFG